MQLSLLQTAAAGVTAEEIARTIHESNPHITKDIVGKLRATNSPSTNMDLASAVFAQNNLKYARQSTENYPNKKNWKLFKTLFPF